MPHVNRSPVARRRSGGFTLLELLIASIIFAIMAIMAYGGLENVIRNSDASKQSLKRLQHIQQAVSVMNRDFTQIINRPVRDEYGNTQAAISATGNLDNAVEFSRGGRVNPANLLRSTLLRVAYQFDDEKLVRLQWPQMDRAPGMEARKTEIIDDVEDFTLRYLDQDGDWQEQWPPLNAGDGTSGGEVPTLFAIEVVLTLKDWGDIRRLYAMQ